MKDITKRIIAAYSILLGVMVLLMWVFILAGGQIEEGRTEMIFHLLSELVMAALCILGGILLFKRKNRFVLIAAHAMVVYSVLNAAGFYLQKGEVSMSWMFGALLLCSVFILTTLLRDAGYDKK
jgi:hypothetical protein